MNPILQISHLNIGYTSKKQQICIAKEINTTIKEAKFIALLGKNGVGKSTLLRTIANMQASLHGEIFIEGKNSKTLSPVAFSKKVSVVLTERIPPSNLSVYEIIALGRQVYTDWIGNLSKADRFIIDDVMNQVQIQTLKNKKIDELSDGQYQKVMIARALAQNTPIILLDEPTAHLDIINKAEIFKLLKSLVKTKNKTIVISSHELQLAIQSTDDLWLMTDEGFVSGNKNHLITTNALQGVFKSDIVSFDAQTNQFVFQ